MNDTKRCPKCEETKPRDQFHRNGKTKDGCYWICRECYRGIYNNKRPPIPRVWTGSLCVENGCDRPQFSRWVCKRHYNQALNRGDLSSLPPRKKQGQNQQIFVVDGMKLCYRCKVDKPVSEFGRDVTHLSGYTSSCKSCQRHYKMLRIYGIGQDDYEALVARQYGRCAICRCLEEEAGGNGFCVDHDHETGSVRGVLCSTCNTGIGQFGDDPDRLIAAATYLRMNERG